jgi:uncharacterized protein YbjT (DUF2867 family)
MLILVTGATGAQGGATAKALLNEKIPVRVLVRNPGSDDAKALAAMGAEVVKGDFNDKETLVTAMQGVYGVFSMQQPAMDDSDSERRHGKALVEAALAAEVTHFVHTSVCEAGNHTQFPRWGSGHWGEKYWTDKWDVEEMVRNANFTYWTVLKPAFMMDNFIEPKASRMFPHLQKGKLFSAFKPDTKLQLICADDVGAFAKSAFIAPEKFHEQNIPLAAEALTTVEMAAAMAEGLGRPVVVETATPEEAVSAGLFKGWVRSQEWVNETGGYRADMEAAKQWGVPLTSFSQWIERHAGVFNIDP